MLLQSQFVILTNFNNCCKKKKKIVSDITHRIAVQNDRQEKKKKVLLLVKACKCYTSTFKVDDIDHKTGEN